MVFNNMRVYPIIAYMISICCPAGDVRRKFESGWRVRMAYERVDEISLVKRTCRFGHWFFPAGSRWINAPLLTLHPPWLHPSYHP